MAVADTINEINAIINALKAQAEQATPWDAGAKQALENRIARLRDKTSGATTLTDDLNDLATKKTPICGLGYKIIGLK